MFNFYNRDSIAPVSPLKKPKRNAGQPQPEINKLDFGNIGKLSSSNYKSTSSLGGLNNLNISGGDLFSRPTLGIKTNGSSLFNSLKKKDTKFFNDLKSFEPKGLFGKDSGLLEKSNKGSFLKGRDSVGGGVDMNVIAETSNHLKGLSSKEVETLSNSQVKELLNLANLITKIAKNTKYYS